VTAFEVRAVLESPHPAIKAIEGVATTVAPFILLFAATYFVMSESSTGHFSAALSREDALYFAVTVFASVGFGDITATTTAARMVVTLQMVLNLLVLGAGVRVFVGAVTLGRKRGAGSVPDGHAP
ncbi:MAG: potassium channel family protein, partial [Nocardioides sp.]